MILYKYTKFQNFLPIAERSTLAFPLVSQLNDPCESSIESALSRLRTLERLPPLAYTPVVGYRVGQFKDVGLTHFMTNRCQRLKKTKGELGKTRGSNG